MHKLAGLLLLGTLTRTAKSKQDLIVMTNGDNGYRLYSLDLGREIMCRAK